MKHEISLEEETFDDRHASCQHRRQERFPLNRAGQRVSRYGLVVVLAWIGFGKYVKMEARVALLGS